MTPMDRYQQDLSREGFSFDAAQQMVVGELDALYQRISVTPPRFWQAGFWTSQDVPQGLYICGRVGRGKTYLMDCFYECLPAGLALRLHFHRFMRRVHRQLDALSGEKNPLDRVAADLAREARVLCFDEFFVSDIGDAMILANLLQGLFARGVVLVTTSNLAPVDLYRDGLQRQRFLPAIDLLSRHTRLLSLDGEVDHRLRELPSVPRYFQPLDVMAEQQLAKVWCEATADRLAVVGLLSVLGRKLMVRGVRIAERPRASVVWFDFMALCDGPRSQLDYIELSERFQTILVSHVPVMGGRVSTRKIAIGTEDSGAEHNTIGHVDRSVQQGYLDDPARRFIALVDELYDRHTRLIVSAAAPIRELYLGGRVSFEFRRTESRLLEMQTEGYLTQLPAC